MGISVNAIIAALIRNTSEGLNRDAIYPPIVGPRTILISSSW